MCIFSLIVARKESKGLKEKVVQKINNKYIFEYSIEYSLGLADKFNKKVLTVVSSDSEIIEDYCLRKNITFIRRSPKLTSDIIPIEDVIYDAYVSVGRKFKYISLLYGNIPLRYYDEFLRAFTFLEENFDYDAVLSMQNVEKYNPAWMFEFNENVLPIKEKQGFRRQDLKPFMIHDGHTVLIRADYFIEFMNKGKATKVMYESFGRKIKPLLNTKLIIDIDTKKDLEMAEAIVENLKN